MKLSKTPTNLSNHNKNKFANLADSRLLPELDQTRKKLLSQFFKDRRVRFRSLELLNLSFVHRSVSNESKLKVNNERLEFLGDAILGAVTAGILYAKFKDKAEGDLAKIKSVVVSEDILSQLALEMQLDTFLLLGKGEELSGGRTKKAILADALEALIGAVYLDSGFKEAESFIGPLICNEIDKVMESGHFFDFKSVLQEFSQKKYRKYPSYRLVKQSGPEHSRIFWIEVTVDSIVYGPATGKTIKSAEQEAAKIAYNSIAPRQ